jgi:hypothetical protein
MKNHQDRIYSEKRSYMHKKYICHIDFSKKGLYTVYTPPEIASPDRHPQQCGMAFLIRINR